MKRIAWIVFGCMVFANIKAESLMCSKQIADLASSSCSAIAAICPNSIISSAEKGDLDGDGIDDIVYVAYSKSSNSFVVGVLRGQQDGKYMAWAESMKFNPTQHDPEVYIKRSSFFIVITNNTLNDSTSSETQFKFGNNYFFKIGEEIDYTSPLHDDSPGPGISSRTSTNYLTGVQIQTDKNDDKVKTIKKKLPKSSLKMLEDFSP